MQEPQSLFIINPLVYSDLKKYIWFNKDAKQKEGALAVFCRLLISEIYIYGFATDEEEYVGKKAFHKPIVDIRGLNVEETVVFIERECSEKIYNICQKIKIVNPAINSDKMVVFGVGKYGMEAYEQLSQEGLRKGIYCFIDSDKDKCGEGKYKENLPIHSPEILSKLGDDFCVIECAEQYMEMDKQLEREGCLQQRFYYREDRYDYLKYVWGYDQNVELRVGTLADMGEAFGGKKIFLYGNFTRGAIKTAKILELLDYEFGGFLADEREEYKTIIDKYPIRLVEDIVKAKNCYILLSNDDKKECAKKLQKFGLKKGMDYNYTTLFSWGNIKESMWDINLGYTYKEGSKYPGIAVYGDENEKGYKIAILGNSTTEDGFIDNGDKCWPRILYEKCKDRKITIYNGGCSGYSSTQELIKLIRDLLPLMPDLIIVFDGFIDICENANKIFSFPYLNKLLETAKNGKEIITYEGADRNGSVFQSWLLNMELMKAIAQERGSDFLAFAQPSRFLLEKEEVSDYLLSATWFWDEQAKNLHIDFKKELKQNKSKAKHDYIYDFTDIFDDKPGIYIDSCHVREEGNEIIAERIFNIINSKLLRIPVS